MRAIWLTTMLPLTACVQGGNAAADPSPPMAIGGTCRADGLMAFTGKKMTDALSREMLRASGAKTMRAGGPDTAMTMDYREDRLTIVYDKDMFVASARCG